MNPTHHDLCSGILGFSLAARWAGFDTTLTCEINPFCQQIIKRELPNAKHFSDLFTLSGSLLAPATVVTAGIPCQPYSQAGKLGLHNDDRYLWPEVLRYLKENRSHWFVLENVSNFEDVGLDSVRIDLEGNGFSTVSFTLPACAVGLPQRRDRVFLVAHANSYRLEGSKSVAFSRINEVSWNTYGRGFEVDLQRLVLFEPRLCRTLTGIPSAVDRVTAIGNSVVPQLAYQILRTIHKIEYAFS